MPTLSYQNRTEHQRERRASLRRAVFGVSPEDVWPRFADRVGGVVIPGLFSTVAAVRIPFIDGRTITLDTHTASSGDGRGVHTRLRTPHPIDCPFRFTLRRATALTPLARFFGRREVNLGDPAFHERFVLRANHKPAARYVFAHSDLRFAIRSLGQIDVRIGHEPTTLFNCFREDPVALRLQTPGVIVDLDHLQALYELFTILLDRLYELHETAP